MLHPRLGRHAVRLLAIALALVVTTPVAATAGSGPGSQPLIRPTEPAFDRFAFDRPDTRPAPVRLDCRSHHEDTVAVGCAWSSDAAVARWELWNLQIAPEGGARNLVASLDPDVFSYRDTAVDAPAVYLYAVLGLDGDGEIVARSRVDKVRVKGPSLAGIRLECDAVLDEPADRGAIGCAWSGPETVDIRAYEVYRADGDAPWGLIATVGSDVTRLLDPDVAPGIRYRYRVAGLGADGSVVAVSRVDTAGFAAPERDRPEREPDEDRPAERDRRPLDPETAPNDTDAAPTDREAAPVATDAPSNDTAAAAAVVEDDDAEARPDLRIDRDRRERPVRDR